MVRKTKDAFDVDSFSAIMSRWGSSVWRLALVRTGSRSDADDVFQDVFLAMLSHCPLFDSDEACKSWLLRCTINRCNDIARRARKHPIVTLDDNDTAPLSSLCVDNGEMPEDVILNQEEYQNLWEAVAHLTSHLREVIHLHYFEELDCGTIASVLGCSVATVHLRLHRARKLLRHMLQ